MAPPQALRLGTLSGWAGTAEDPLEQAGWAEVPDGRILASIPGIPTLTRESAGNSQTFKKPLGHILVHRAPPLTEIPPVAVMPLLSSLQHRRCLPSHPLPNTAPRAGDHWPPLH